MNLLEVVGGIYLRGRGGDVLYLNPLRPICAAHEMSDHRVSYSEFFLQIEDAKEAESTDGGARTMNV